MRLSLELHVSLGGLPAGRPLLACLAPSAFAFPRFHTLFMPFHASALSRRKPVPFLLDGGLSPLERAADRIIQQGRARERAGVSSLFSESFSRGFFIICT